MSGPADDFRAAMRGLASGISIITSRDGEGDGAAPCGMAATAVTSVTANPPTILICVNRSASMHPSLERAGIFAVNFLSQAQGDLVTAFSSSERRHLRFKEGQWGRLVTGAPVLEAAVASLDCRVCERVNASTHTIFLGRVEASVASEGAMPLIHFGGMPGEFVARA